MIVIIGGRDGTLGLMIVVLIVAVPITVMYSIYVATEAARSKCLALLVIISEFVAGISFILVFITFTLVLDTCQ